ncbi:MAG: hypothetical protein A2505_10360 [Deltaproteobacteria bacterium RIFOXYD12_FULL_55_16]|nr:MAG: hypothetical protein A2505_10360 [Deltaproteobacteria bacterium RIFOXYD12_FULL_55_16]
MDTVKEILFGRYRLEELIDVFSFLSAEERKELFTYLDLREWQPGELVLESGEPANFMGFLVEGKLSVRMAAIFPGKFILLAVLERGSLIGEVSVVEEGCRHATVVATEKSSLLILTRGNMDLLLRQTPALGLKLLRRIIHVLGHRLSKASDRLARLL